MAGTEGNDDRQSINAAITDGRICVWGRPEFNTGLGDTRPANEDALARKE